MSRVSPPEGVVVLDKPSGPTSHDMVNLVRRVFDTRRVGHTGTLDPIATGVLPICLGQATRLARFLAESEKSYRAVARLGFSTSTDDLSGEPLGAPRDGRVSEESLRAVLSSFVGPLDQIPPAFSAKRVDGMRAYEMARAGREVRLASSRVTVRRIDLVRQEEDRFVFDVVCSAGTYVRSLARDVGAALRVGAHLVALRRTRSGGFGLEAAVVPESLGEGGDGVIVPLSRLLAHWPSVRVPDALLAWVRNGRVLSSDALPEPEGGGGDQVRLLRADGELVALARRIGAPNDEGPLPRPGGFHPFVVFAPAGS